LGITQEMVVSKYLRERKDKVGEYLASKIPCPFLKKNRCSIYEVRPKGCKSYPHIKNTKSILRLVDSAEDGSICPIIASVRNHLKAEIPLGQA
jgi:Fe-S-cluster containining protein